MNTETIKRASSFTIDVTPSNAVPPSDLIWGMLLGGNRLAWCNVTVTLHLGECTTAATATNVSFRSLRDLKDSLTYTVLCNVAATKFARSLSLLDE